MRTSTVLFSSLLLAFACKSEDSEKEGTSASTPAAAGEAPAAEGAASGGLYDESIREDPCALLTTDMVAKVANKPAAEIEQRNVSAMCLYSWEGGNAGIAFVKAHKSVERAKVAFENSHKNMSGAEVKAAMDTIGEKAKENLKEEAKAGKKVPGADAVDPVAGAVAKSMGGGITFEPVDGLGDMAAYETTRHENKIAGMSIVSYANKIDVVTGNLSFDLSFAYDAADRQGTMQKDEAIALAKAVLAGLPSAK
jgi:hypothetical protein